MNVTKLSARLAGSVKVTDDLAGAIESIALAVVSRAASWAAAIPNAVIVSRATQEIFGLSPGWSGVVAVSLELVGQGVSNLWLRGIEWNRRKRKTDPSANTRLAFGLMCGYFALDVGIIVSLAVPNWLQSGDVRQLVAIFYPVCGIISTVVLNERAAQFRREADVEREKAARKQQMQKRKQEKQNESGFRCGICGYSAKSQLALNGHMKAHSNGGKAKAKSALETVAL